MGTTFMSAAWLFALAAAAVRPPGVRTPLSGPGRADTRRVSRICRAGASSSLDDVQGRLARTRWSVLLHLDEGARTLFSWELRQDGTSTFSNHEMEGTWCSREDVVVVKQPCFLFGNDLYYSGRITDAQPAGAANDLANEEDGVPLRMKDCIVETAQGKELTRIGTFSAHQLLDGDEDAGDEEDLDDEFELP